MGGGGWGCEVELGRGVCVYVGRSMVCGEAEVEVGNFY